MKNLSDIPPDTLIEAAGFFPQTEEHFRRNLELSQKVFTPREQEELFRELSQRGTTEAAALVFIMRVGSYIKIDGFFHILEHCREVTPAPDMVKALGDITTAIDAAFDLPDLYEVLEKVPLSGYLHDGEGTPFPCKAFLTYSVPPDCSRVPPQPMSLPRMMLFLKEQLERMEIDNRRGPKVRKHRRRIIRDMARIWEEITGEAPTISDRCGFLYAMGIIWDATARAALAHIDAREKFTKGELKLPRVVDLSPLNPEAPKTKRVQEAREKKRDDALRNDLRHILKEKNT
jgi:hypothetical protein